MRHPVRSIPAIRALRLLCAAGLLVLSGCDDAAPGSGGSDAALDTGADLGGPADAAADAAPVDADLDMGLADAGSDARVDAAPADATPDDALPDVSPPDDRLGGLGEPCPRGAARDCDPEVAELCVFVGENEVVPGVTAVCSRACDEGEPCGDGFCCLQEAGGARCLPAGFCAERAHIGDPCARDADCPIEAPLCATESGTGARFCTHGCANGGACEPGFCCDANAGGRPMGAVCKPTELCPEPCADDADCPAVQFCADGACVPRAFLCEGDVDCPPGEVCIEGECREGREARLGESCEADDVVCGPAAPVCYQDEETAPFCTYSCTFHRDCPATYCCLDLVGLDDDAGLFCTDQNCPPNLPCEDDAECAPDEFCHQALCQPRGPMDVAPGGACEGPGDCAPEAEVPVDCVFPVPGDGVKRGQRAAFDGAGAGICSAPCTRSEQCPEGACCRIALQIRADFGVGHCVEGGVCEPGGGGGGGGRGCHPSNCNPALWDRCVPDRWFGSVCSRQCASDDDCPGEHTCGERDGFCHPPNRCDADADCGPDNRCVEQRCLEGVRQCTVDEECGDLEDLRCDEGRCEARARPCAGDADCAANEVCFDNQCELADRPCAGDAECRFGEACVDAVCRAITLGFGAACNEGGDFPCDPQTAPICLVDGDVLPDGQCSTRCQYASDCPGAYCCLDHAGLGDPEFFVCAPEVLCDEGAAVVNARRPCDADADCLGEDFCHRGLCFDDGDRAGAVDAPCIGPGDCALAGAPDHCVLPREFGFAAGALESTPDATGAGTCQPRCSSDADCDGCCRHALEAGEPVGYCLPAAQCAPVGDPGDLCFPGAHDECDPATTDACIFVEAAETTYCSNRCDDDADCGDGCCGEVAGGRFCLQAAACR